MAHSSEKERRITDKKLESAANLQADYISTKKYDDSPNMSPKYSNFQSIWSFTFFFVGPWWENIFIVIFVYFPHKTSNLMKKKKYLKIYFQCKISH